ncbi:MAG: DUF4838 domain-containing protein [Lentisphaerae bacterium]|nr:DUF4838 domain-containing protein [Lentisphaerota bacterium]
MTTLTIAAAIPGFADNAHNWETSENDINFRSSPALAERCTVSFAACELRRFLPRTIGGLEIALAEKPPADASPYIALECRGLDFQYGAFDFKLESPAGLRISGADRNGVINGIYEFLRLQGWDWLEPGARGEYVPEFTDRVVFPGQSRTFKPSCNYRSFCEEGASKESEEYLFWMARNRMNCHWNYPLTRKLARKFGMYIQVGGHVYHEILDPKRLLAGGRRLFDLHPEWYGTPRPPAIKTADNAQGTQFCSSNPELMDFLADELLRLLKTDWYEADIVALVGFDTWGATCQCPDCQKLGGDTDKNIAFLAAQRRRIDRAVADGALDHNVMLNMDAYEGTSTMRAPEREIPKEMIAARDFVSACVINRCYRHAIGEGPCEKNEMYAEDLRGWGKQKLCLSVLEYYNVSRHEDMPLVFAHNMQRTQKFCRKLGARAVSYMHSPLANWGFRAQNQVLHALLAWDIDADLDAFLEYYYARRYEVHAGAMREAYDAVEEATLEVAEWRAWFSSILADIASYRGLKPARPIRMRHYASQEEAIREGTRIVSLYEKAIALTRASLEREREIASGRMAAPGARPSNPAEAYAFRTYDRTANVLAEDLRGLLYARDVFALMTLVVDHYDANFLGCEARMLSIRDKILKLADHMDTYWVPMNFPNAAGFRVSDALTRSQMRPQVDGIRRNRGKAGGN